MPSVRAAFDRAARLIGPPRRQSAKEENTPRGDLNF
jgi:hypothetical protein